MLVVVCAWCERFLGFKQTNGAAAISHGMCHACLARHQWDDAPTLVVSRGRAPLLPVFQEILRGTPEIRVVVDRRQRERRRIPGPDSAGGRRGPERRGEPVAVVG